MGVCRVAVHGVAAAPGQHGLGDVGQTEGDTVQLLQSRHEAAVLTQGLADELGQAYCAVIAGNIETLLTLASCRIKFYYCMNHTLTDIGRPYSAPLSSTGILSRSLAQSLASVM